MLLKKIRLSVETSYFRISCFTTSRYHSLPRTYMKHFHVLNLFSNYLTEHGLLYSFSELNLPEGQGEANAPGIQLGMNTKMVNHKHEEQSKVVFVWIRKKKNLGKKLNPQ